MTITERTDEMVDSDEILESLEKEMTNLCYHEPASPVEMRLANAMACLIAVIRKERVVDGEKEPSR